MSSSGANHEWLRESLMAGFFWKLQFTLHWWNGKHSYSQQNVKDIMKGCVIREVCGTEKSFLQNHNSRIRLIIIFLWTFAHVFSTAIKWFRHIRCSNFFPNCLILPALNQLIGQFLMILWNATSIDYINHRLESWTRQIGNILYRDSLLPFF